MLLAWEGVLPWLEAIYLTEPHDVNNTMEGVAGIHGDIHEAAPSELWEKVSFAPTNELS